MATAVSLLIQAPLTGKDFLQSSHIPFGSADNGGGPDQFFKTTFRKDFHPFPTLPRRGAVPRPAPAQVEHRDLARIKEYVTEAVKSYPRHPQIALSRTPAWTKLCTNFKMHTDPRNVSYLTTQADGFKPQSTSLSRITQPIMVMKKNQPMEKLPETTHKATFPSYIVSPIVKAKVKHLGGEPTIKGDMSIHHFNSNHNEAFQGKWTNPPQPVEKHFASSVAMGDPKKMFLAETTHDVSFTHPGASGLIGKKKRLQVNLGDYSKNTWTSTTSEAFLNVKSEPMFLMQRNKTLSSVPRGDTDQGRNRERMMATTNSFFYPKWSHRGQTLHVSGANLRTKSNVQLGRPSLGDLFYSTTAQEHYPRRDLTRVRPHTHPSGQVLAGQEPGPALTTVQMDFIPPNCKRQVLHSNQLQQIKESHIKAPYNQQHFSTTHKGAFGPKSLSKTCLDNPPRQHVSHIPF